MPVSRSFVGDNILNGFKIHLFLEIQSQGTGVLLCVQYIEFVHLVSFHALHYVLEAYGLEPCGLSGSTRLE